MEVEAYDFEVVEYSDERDESHITYPLHDTFASKGGFLAGTSLSIEYTGCQSFSSVCELGRLVCEVGESCLGG